MEVVGLEEPLLAAQLHGPVGVGEEVGEARGKVAHEVVGQGAQRLPHLRGQLPVVVLLQTGDTDTGCQSGTRTRWRETLDSRKTEC